MWLLLEASSNTVLHLSSVSRTPVLTAFGEVSVAVLQTELLVGTFDTQSTRSYPSMSTLLDRIVQLQLQPSCLFVNAPCVAYVRDAHRRREKPIGPFGVMHHR
jgi:hypothetical protein